DDVEKALAENHIPTEHAQITMVPDNMITLGGEDAQKLETMIDAFDELDDVQDVYHNGDMPDDTDEE
ncbi:YebC/PmpR family DNA-binding transcriptional regulator, partial [Colibacter massiliensis]|uniref:YebC/PmpR family DNA-binding transcriptional regulator n=1 Tax=Colibacter massiliensis TaxID=1852379 RepID=UPI003C6EAC5B